MTGPLTDNVAADLAFYGYHQGEGCGHNHFLDRDQNRNMRGDEGSQGGCDQEGGDGKAE